MFAEQKSFDDNQLVELTADQTDAVSGGMNDWTEGGIAVMGLGLAGGPVTAGFGMAIGLSMLVVGYYAN